MDYFIQTGNLSPNNDNAIVIHNFFGKQCLSFMYNSKSLFQIISHVIIPNPSPKPNTEFSKRVHFYNPKPSETVPSLSIPCSKKQKLVAIGRGFNPSTGRFCPSSGRNRYLGELRYAIVRNFYAYLSIRWYYIEVKTLRLGIFFNIGSQ